MGGIKRAGPVKTNTRISRPNIMYVWSSHFLAELWIKRVNVADPFRGQLNRENEHFPVPVRAWEFGLARQVRSSRPASVCSCAVLRLDLVESRVL